MEALGDDRILLQAEQCTECLQASPEAQRQSLERGLQLTSQALGLPEQRGVVAENRENVGARAEAVVGSGAAPLAAERRQRWRAIRLRLLQHLERLDTSLAMLGSGWSPAAYASLRDCTIAEAALALAAAGRLSALPLLLTRHPRALLPSMLDVLSAIPETVDHKQCAPLLRQVAALRQPPPLPRQTDWAESAAAAAELREAGQYALLLATEPMCASSGAVARGGWHPPTQRQVAQWVCERAQQLDATTGQLPNALALLEAGAAALHYSEPSVGSLLSIGQELLSVIRLATARGEGGSSGAWQMDLRQYAGLAPQQRLSLLLGLLGGDSLADDLALTVAPFLARLADASRTGHAGEAPPSPQVVLRMALESESTKRLAWVVRLVQSEARQRIIFSSAAQLARTAAACCYACGATDAWELLNSMLSAARDAVRADAEMGPEERDAAAEAVAVVRHHVTAARLLTKHGLTTPASTVRDSDRAAALRLLRTLLARVSRTKNTESRWVEVWMDLRTIQEQGFTQLTEEDVRTEYCRALLRVGQFRLCKSYLQPLPLAAAEQLVLTAGREVYLSASNMSDRAVKQAEECFSLLPASAAAREQLVGIAAGEQLQQLGLDLPPLQVQQLRAQAASGDSQVLETLLADHPRLATADSATLGQLAAALGLAAQQQPLLLRAATAAHAAGDVPRAESLLRLLAGQHYMPAWQLAAAVASDPRCTTGSRPQLLVFALSAAPPERLLALLQQWQAADGGEAASSGATASCWERFSAALPSTAASDSWQEEQRWLARQLRMHLISLGRTSSSSSGGGSSGNGSGTADESAALGCLLALGPRGLQLWEKLLSEKLPRPLGYQQRRRGLLLGLTAGALLALQPADVGSADVAAAAAAAEARLAAPPSELLRLLRVQRQQQRAQQQQQQHGAESARSSRSSSSSGGPRLVHAASDNSMPLSGAVSDSGDPASSSEVSAAGGGGASAPAAAAAAAAAASTAAAAACADRFRGLLLAASDAQHLQRLLPGVDAAAALAGSRDSRRQLVLQLAAAAGKPASLRPSASASNITGMGSRSLSSSLALSPRVRPENSTAASRDSPDGLFQRSVSRKKEEASPGPGEAVSEGADTSLGSPSGGGGGSWQRLDAAVAAETLRQALDLAPKCDVPAWQVHLAFAEALLVGQQQQWGQPGAAAAQLLEASLPHLMSGPQQAAALLQILLLQVWPRCSSRWPQHLLCCLRLMSQCSELLAASPPAGGAGSASTAQRQAAAGALAACHMAAEQLMRAAGGIHAKLFLQPVVHLLAAAAAPPAGTGSGAQHASHADAAAVLNQQLFLHVSSSNASHLESAVGELQQQQAALAASSGAGGSGVVPTYPCSSSTVYLALFCKTLAAESFSQQALAQLCQQCLPHMSPSHVAAAAAFAVADGPCPLALPAGMQLPAAPALPERQQLQLLAAAMETLSTEKAAAAAAAETGTADASLPGQLQLLKQRHALLAAWASLAPACPSKPQLQAARAAAAALQQAALAGGSNHGSGADGSVLPRCLQQLLTTGCPAAGVLQVAAVLQALQHHPGHAPPAGESLLASPAAAAAAQAAVAAAAEASVAAALRAMSAAAAGEAQHAGILPGEQLSAGDAVQNFFALLRSLHPEPHAPRNGSSASHGSSQATAAPAATVTAEAEAVAALRLLVWQHLQQHAAAYDGSGSAAETEAHLQVLELLGTVGTPSMWPGWSPPAPVPAGTDATSSPLATSAPAYSHQRALLFTRTAAVLAVEWPEAVQRCRLSAADFGSAEAAEAALMRLAALAEEAAHLRLLLRLLQDGLSGSFPAAAAGAAALAPEEGGEEEAAAAAGTAGGASVAPLHRVWATCLRMLLPWGDLPGALAALEGYRAQQAQQQAQQQGSQQAQQQAQQGQQAAALTQQEAEAVLEAADATQGAAAAAALALLLPYRSLQQARWQQLLQSCGTGGSTASDLAAGLPGLAPLLLLLVQEQPALLADLAAGGRQQQHLFQLLIAAALQQQAAAPAAYAAPLGGSALMLGTAVAATGAAQLAAAHQYTAAGWLAMHASGTPRLFRVLDNGTRVLQQLLGSCAADGPAAAGAAAAARQLAAGAGPAAGLALTHTTAALLAELPERCANSLAQLRADLQLQ